MSGIDEPKRGGRIDMNRLASNGPAETTKCATCGSPTRSHVVTISAEEVHELDENPLETPNLDPGGRAIFAVMCHGCFDGFSMPAVGSEYDRLIASIRGLSFAGRLGVPS